MEENSIEETIKIIERKIKEAEHYSNITGLCLTLDEELRNALMNILSDYKRVLKKNEELRAKWDKDTHILQNELDYANADRIDLVQQNKELRKENEELKHKIEGQECVIETQTHNEEVYEKLVIKLEKENKLAKQALIKNCNISDERNQLLKENKELKEEKDVDYTTIYLKGIYDEREKWELKEKDKIINAMAKYIIVLDIDEDICKKMGVFKNCEIKDVENCKKCIIKYFREKYK